MSKRSVFILTILATAFWTTRTAAQPKDKDKKPATHKVEHKPFKIELALKGILEPEQTTPIAHRPVPTVGMPYSPGPLTIRQIVEHGARVRKGDVLAVFDPRRLEMAMQQVEADLQGLEASLKLAEEEQPLFEKSLPLDLEQAERSHKEADEDLAYFLKTARAESERRAHQNVKYSAFYLEFAKEQLKQLEKMYKSNDLTEDTEQIILKRQRFFVEEAITDLKSAEMERDYVLKTSLPRREKSFRDSAVRAAMNLEKTRHTQGPQLISKQQNLAKMRFERDKLRKGLEALRGDRAALTVTAPCDGQVYYGKFSKGQWEAGGLSARLAPDGTVQPDEVFLTIVQPQALLVRVQVEEKDAGLVKPGLAGKAHLVFQPALKVPAKVAKVSAIPTTPGKFEALVALEIPADAGLAPGMAATAKFVPYAKKLAVAIPAAALEEEDDKHYVSLLRDGKTVRHAVTPGHTRGDLTEIIEGLRPGDEILLERPGDKKSASKGDAGGDE